MTLDVTNVLLSYSPSIEKLIKLATGRYARVDSYYKHFYAFLDYPPGELEYFLRENSNWFWEEEDMRQEITIVFTRAIRKYFSSAGTKQRRRAYSLAYLLHQRGVLFLTEKINRKLRSLTGVEEYEVVTQKIQDPEMPSLSAIEPLGIWKRRGLTTKEKMLLYRVVWTDTTKTELKEEFGDDWEEGLEVFTN